MILLLIFEIIEFEILKWQDYENILIDKKYNLNLTYKIKYL